MNKSMNENELNLISKVILHDAKDKDFHAVSKDIEVISKLFQRRNTHKLLVTWNIVAVNRTSGLSGDAGSVPTREILLEQNGRAFVGLAQPMHAAEYTMYELVG